VRVSVRADHESIRRTCVCVKVICVLSYGNNLIGHSFSVFGERDALWRDKKRHMHPSVDDDITVINNVLILIDLIVV